MLIMVFFGAGAGAGAGAGTGVIFGAGTGAGAGAGAAQAASIGKANNNAASTATSVINNLDRIFSYTSFLIYGRYFLFYLRNHLLSKLYLSPGGSQIFSQCALQ